MNYAAVNAKVRAMRALLLTERDFLEIISGRDFPRVPDDDFAKISPYLCKNSRDFLAKTMGGFSAVDPKSLDKSSRESIKRVAGVETDLKNILWIFRLKKYYKIHGDKVFAFLSPENFRLSAENIHTLAHANLEAFAQAVSESVYGMYFRDLSDFARGEQILTRAVRSQLKKEARFENLSFACGYLYERRLEQKNLQAISIGLSNGFTSDEIFPLLHL